MNGVPLVRVTSPDRDHRYEEMIVCRDHLRQLTDTPPPVEDLPAAQAVFWNHRCLMCGVDAVPERLCENEDCRRPLHPQWPAVYCCNGCALEDL